MRVLNLFVSSDFYFDTGQVSKIIHKSNCQTYRQQWNDEWTSSAGEQSTTDLL